MNEVIVPRGPLGLKGAYPLPPQSRVVALELHVPAGVGNNDFCYTPALGNRLWLLNIDIWVYCATAGAFIGGFFYLMFGTAEPQNASDISTRWNRIIELYCGAKPGFRWFHCDPFDRHFSMAKLFVADGLRFGVTLENGFNQAWEATIAFEISEG